MFKIGQKIVCINSKSSNPMSDLVLGKIYIIQEIKQEVDGGISFILKNTYNGTAYGFPYFHGYRSERFKPLDESFAEEVLENIKQQIEEEELVKN